MNQIGSQPLDPTVPGPTGSEERIGALDTVRGLAVLGILVMNIVEFAWLMAVVAGVSLVQIAFSILWLRRFRFGPLEWAWRSLTYWRRQPFLHT